MNRSLFDCAGKVAVVTGGAGLIGAEIVRALARVGARVVVADNDPAKARALAGPIGARVQPFDITRPAAVERAFKAVRNRMGRVDILINCAYPRTQDWGALLEDVPPASWRKNVDGHMGGYFFASRAAAEIMKAQGGGSIINFASIYGMVGPDFGVYRGTSMTMPAAYSAIKGGIISFTRYLATYYGPRGVRANAISPGGVLDGQKESFVRRYSQRTPLGRMARPEDLVGATVFLASDASAYVTGTNIVVDGGWTAW